MGTLARNGGTLYQISFSVYCILILTLSLNAIICDGLRDLVPFLQFKEVETCNFTKSNTPQWMFFTFLK